ncbi:MULTISPECIES: glycosyltransferase family 4 protein [Micromonospora]|uniref:Glycosyltransferase involved in cell wall bisynthesis n=1 Tax=Micromonospora yangpuensis TaxID=683228 RepID=A0A1C6UGY4_9ACTN|nr:glycosyltransferase family 4 protein [Micromonospora yangpuensis]GGM04629.1 glycosyltransferase WbuB [Micromonospora yangpuensis]SCL53208.1 Glycosyltransferase involved in cell wall bisynthesis [Micromonospora yangpuensis]
MRIGLLSQWFDPEPGPAALPGVLARGLAGRGHQVRVLTGFPNYPTGRLAPGYRMSRRADETRDGVAVRRVALYPSHDNSPVRRLASYTSFAASALASGTGTLRGLDALWVSNSPITVSLPMWFVRYAHRVPVLLHVLDLWPDSVAASGFLGDGRGRAAAEKCMTGWCAAMYRSAARIGYISPGVGELLARRGVPEEKLVYLPLWAPEETPAPPHTDLRAELGIGPDRIVLVYAGTIGEAQGLDALVDACALVDDPRLVCLVAGSGLAEQRLRERAAASSRDIRFLGRLPRDRMPALMAAGDVHYVSLRPSGMGAYTMPSKVQATLAAGRAVLAAAEGDVATVARDSGAGIVARPGDPDSIADGLREICQLGREKLDLLGLAGREYYRRTFSVATGVDRVEAALRAAAETGRRR